MNGMSAQPPASDPFGWVVVVLGTIAALWTIWAAIYWTIRPGETDPRHPKNLILKDDR